VTLLLGVAHEVRLRLRRRRDPATAEALAARLEDDARVDPLRDDALCRWLAPEVLERLPAARDGRTARSGERDDRRADPGVRARRGAEGLPWSRRPAVPGHGPAFPVPRMNDSSSRASWPAACFRA
jgi:hypothetical protein